MKYGGVFCRIRSEKGGLGFSVINLKVVICRPFCNFIEVWLKCILGSVDISVKGGQGNVICV